MEGKALSGNKQNLAGLFIPVSSINTPENTEDTCSHTVRSGTLPDGFHSDHISYPEKAITFK